jgi:uncharacterized protein YbaP (TraB family)
MIRYKTRNIINVLIIVLLLIPCQLFARQATQNDCRALEPAVEITEEPSKYADALLWKVSKDNLEPSYLFGTIHVSDPKIVNLPQAVSSALNASDIFVMEAIPELEESLKLTQMMFFDDGRTLKDYIDDALFNKIAEILKNYQLSVEVVMFMKPWAAFLVMNYPVNQGMPLDLELLTTAQQNGAEIYGLESLSEQGDIFSTMELETQVQLLLDTVCNYEVVSNEFEKMKSLYLARDLNGLIVNSNKYSLSQETIYKDLVKRLLTDRNYIMADRMQTVLEKGNAFIAIGAMHLPGDEGVLSLLDKQGYQITSIY